MSQHDVIPESEIKTVIFSDQPQFQQRFPSIPMPLQRVVWRVCRRLCPFF
jgi:hypothetical protein